MHNVERRLDTIIPGLRLPSAVRRVGLGMRRDKPTPSVRLDEHFALNLCKSRVRDLLLFLFLAHSRTALAMRPGKLGLAQASETKVLTLHYATWLRSVVSGL